MSKTNFLKNLASQLSDLLPSQVSAFRQDFEKNCHDKLRQIFNKFDLVTREEFDIQSRVLIRTRKKLDELSAHIQELEMLYKEKEKEKDKINK